MIGISVIIAIVAFTLVTAVVITVAVRKYKANHKVTTRKESNHKVTARKESNHKETTRKESNHKVTARKESNHKETTKKESIHEETTKKESNIDTKQKANHTITDPLGTQITYDIPGDEELMWYTLPDDVSEIDHNDPIYHQQECSIITPEGIRVTYKFSKDLKKKWSELQPYATNIPTSPYLYLRDTFSLPNQSPAYYDIFSPVYNKPIHAQYWCTDIIGYYEPGALEGVLGMHRYSQYGAYRLEVRKFLGIPNNDDMIRCAYIDYFKNSVVNLQTVVYNQNSGNIKAIQVFEFSNLNDYGNYVSDCMNDQTYKHCFFQFLSTMHIFQPTVSSDYWEDNPRNHCERLAAIASIYKESYNAPFLNSEFISKGLKDTFKTSPCCYERTEEAKQLRHVVNVEQRNYPPLLADNIRQFTPEILSTLHEWLKHIFCFVQPNVSVDYRFAGEQELIRTPLANANRIHLIHTVYHPYDLLFIYTGYLWSIRHAMLSKKDNLFIIFPTHDEMDQDLHLQCIRQAFMTLGQPNLTIRVISQRI